MGRGLSEQLLPRTWLLWGLQWVGGESLRKAHHLSKSHTIPSVVKRYIKQYPNNLSLEMQLFAGVSKPFWLIHSSFLLIDISLICENQNTITPDFLPH